MKKTLFLLMIFINIIFYPSLSGLTYGGILPITHFQGKILFLIGQERGGKHPGTWSDFGGKGNAGESFEQTAAREFHEESREAYSDMKDTIKKILQEPTAGIKSPGSGYYKMYIVPLPHRNPEDPTQGRGRDREKMRFLWVDAEDLVNQLKNQSRTIKSGEHPSYNSHALGIIPIRRPFANFFLNQESRALIEQKIRAFKKIVTSQHTTTPSIATPSIPIQQMIAGVLPVAFHDRKTYFLIGKERDSETWSDFNGLSNINFEENAKRIFDNETNKIYKNIEINPQNVIFHPGNGAELFYKMFVTQVPYYENIHTLLSPPKGINKNDFLWVNAEDFIKQLSDQEYGSKKIMYDTKTSNYGVIQIKPLFAQYFLSEELDDIENIIKQQMSSLIQPTQSPAQGPLPINTKPGAQNSTEQLMHNLSNLNQKLRELTNLLS